MLGRAKKLRTCEQWQSMDGMTEGGTTLVMKRSAGLITGLSAVKWNSVRERERGAAVGVATLDLGSKSLLFFSFSSSSGE